MKNLKKKCNKKETVLSNIVFLLACITLLISLLFNDLQDIECSKKQGVCSIYKRDVISGNTSIQYYFNISDVDWFEIEKQHYGRCRGYYVYCPILYLRTGERIFIDNCSRSFERAQNMYNNIVTQDFVLKGNVWNSFWGNY